MGIVARHSHVQRVNDVHCRLALAEPKTVPAGIYAKEYLQTQKLWSAVEAKVIPTENVRAALAAVEAGNVEAGIVYKTDAAISKKVKVAFEVPRAEGPAISYPMSYHFHTTRAEIQVKPHNPLLSRPPAVWSGLALSWQPRDAREHAHIQSATRGQPSGFKASCSSKARPRGPLDRGLFRCAPADGIVSRRIQ